MSINIALLIAAVLLAVICILTAVGFVAYFLLEKNKALPDKQAELTQQQAGEITSTWTLLNS